MSEERGKILTPGGGDASAAVEMEIDAATFARKRLSADIMGVDPKTTDPRKHYRWVRNDPQRIAKAKLQGYEVETIKGGVRTIVEQDRGGDSAIRRGDLILMSIRKDVYEYYTRQKHARGEKLLASTSAETEEIAKQKGIRVIKDSDHAQQTVEGVEARQ